MNIYKVTKISIDGLSISEYYVAPNMNYILEELKQHNDYSISIQTVAKFVTIIEEEK